MNLEPEVYTVEAVRAMMGDDEDGVYEVVDRFSAMALDEGIDFSEAAGLLLRDAYAFAASAIDSVSRVINAPVEDVLDAYVVHAMGVEP